MTDKEEPQPWHDYEDGLALLPDDGRKHLFDEPKNVRRFIVLLVITCAILFLLDLVFLFEHKHLSFEEGAFSLEGWFGFYAVYGFAACTSIVLTARFVVRALLQRKEDYYDE